ncbi:MAG: hypothetical protein ACREPS_01650 [Rhodanobacteraceae bacterium]
MAINDNLPQFTPHEIEIPPGTVATITWATAAKNVTFRSFEWCDADRAHLSRPLIDGRYVACIVENTGNGVAGDWKYHVQLTVTSGSKQDLYESPRCGVVGNGLPVIRTK